MPSKGSRILFSDLLRIAAIFGAILIHVSASNIVQVPTDSLAFYSFNIYDSIARYCVPVFVMLSGLLFLDPNRKVPTKKIFSRYIPRIAAALLLYGSAYFILLSYLEYGVADPQFFKDGFLAVMSGEARYHLWYLYMIIGLYLITPFLRVFISKASKRDMEYFLLLFLIFSGIFFPLAKLPYFDALSSLVSQVQPALAFGYIGYYVLGYYLYAYSFSTTRKRLLYATGIFSFLFTAIATQLLSLSADTLVPVFYSYFSLNVILMSSALFVFFKDRFTDKNPTPRISGLASTIARASFTMYLIHDFFLIGFSRIGLSTLSFSPAWSPLILSLLTFTLSLLAALICNGIVHIISIPVRKLS